MIRIINTQARGRAENTVQSRANKWHGRFLVLFFRSAQKRKQNIYPKQRWLILVTTHPKSSKKKKRTWRIIKYTKQYTKQGEDYDSLTNLDSFALLRDGRIIIH